MIRWTGLAVHPPLSTPAREGARAGVGVRSLMGVATLATPSLMGVLARELPVYGPAPVHLLLLSSLEFSDAKVYEP